MGYALTDACRNGLTVARQLIERTLMRFCAGLATLVAATSIAASGLRSLDQDEERQLREFASSWIIRFARMQYGQNSDEVWYVRSSVSDESGTAHATIVFKPANTRDYCLAPVARFVGVSRAGESWAWETKPTGARAISYRFWFESCNRADREYAIKLDQALDFDVLEKIGAARESIIGSMRDRLGAREIGDTSVLRLDRISLYYNVEDGPVYRVFYMARSHTAFTADVVFESRQRRIVKVGWATRN